VVQEAFWQAPTLYIFSYIFILLGATMIVVATFGMLLKFPIRPKKFLTGCCGASQESRLLLGLYGGGTMLLLIFTISCGIYLLYSKDGVFYYKNYFTLDFMLAICHHSICH
jgi:hypothetical protein